MPPRVALLVLVSLFACTSNPRFLLGQTDDTGDGDASTSGTGTGGTAPGTTTGTTGDDTTGAGTAIDATASLTTGLMTTGEPATDTGDTGDSTTGAGGESSSSGGDTGGAHVCGDGVLDDDEQCDDGAMNDDAGLCTSACQLALCGDGLVREHGPDPEQCDQGPMNGSGLEACSSDCAAFISSKTYEIVAVSSGVPGTLHDNNSQVASGIAAGDDACRIKAGIGYKILAADGVKRVASLTPWAGDGSVDWVLKPYTGYTDEGGVLLGITGKERLLGVQNGAMLDLSMPFTDSAHSVWTGLLSSWVSAENNCVGWTTKNASKTGKAGDSGKLDGYLDGAGDKSCSNSLRYYCVEQ